MGCNSALLLSCIGGFSDVSERTRSSQTDDSTAHMVLVILSLGNTDGSEHSWGQHCPVQDLQYASLRCGTAQQYEECSVPMLATPCVNACRGCSAEDALDGVLTSRVQACSNATGQ